MANRHLSRSIVLQSLFEWDFRATKDSEVASMIDRNLKEFAPGHPDGPFARELGKLVMSKKTIIDEVIVKAAPEWPMEKIGIIDRNILRIGLCELLFSDRNHVPPKVAINESIELAKAFGADASPKFVNGVLGAVYKELGEPGKNDVGKNINNDSNPLGTMKTVRSFRQPAVVETGDLPIEKKAGAVVYAEHEGTIYFAFVHDIFGFWTLSKGGVKEDEDEKAGAVREIKDELGIDIKIISELGRNEYLASHPTRGKTRKQVVYFLGKSEFVDLQLEKSGGLDDAKWFPLSALPNLTLYENIVPLLAQAIEIVTKDKI